MTPLMFRIVRRRFCVTQLCSPVSRPGCAGIRASPWVVEAQVVASSPALALRAGVNLAFQATKKTPRLCAEVSDLIY